MTITESGMLTLINPVPRAEPFDHPDWVFEAAAENVRGRLISCNGNRMQRFEGVLDLVFDGEVVVLDYAERPPFNELHRKTISQDNDKLRGNAVMTKPFAALAWPLAAALLVFNGVAGAAQFLPYHPLTMVVPFAAGGPTDVLGRVIAGRMSEVLGQNVVVDNVVGAGGMIGSARVAYAAPDGYQFVLGTVGTHAQEQTLYKHPPYDATTDFTPVILIAEVPLVLETRKDLQVSNFRDFVAYAKRHQGGMLFGSAGAGSATHLGCVLLNNTIGVKTIHVPYPGTGPALRDLEGGRIDYMCDVITTAKPPINNGAVKGLAILDSKRSPALPNLPTAAEEGAPNLVADTWNAIFLPKNTPAPIVKTVHDAALAAMHTPAVRERLNGLGAEIVPDDQTTPQYLGNFVKSEIAKWAALIKASGVSVQ